MIQQFFLCVCVYCIARIALIVLQDQETERSFGLSPVVRWGLGAGDCRCLCDRHDFLRPQYRLVASAEWGVVMDLFCPDCGKNRCV